ncbi:MAG: HNH endonuclease [Actinobacteria bacterium]|nr:HNH endonuclease [Actinomycetota bacterium]
MSSTAPAASPGLPASVVEARFEELVADFDADRVRTMLACAPSFEHLVELASIDPGRLPADIDRLRMLKAVDRAQGKVDAFRMRTLLAVAGEEWSGDSELDRQVRHDIGVMLRVNKNSIGAQVARSRRLHQDAPAWLDALDAGEISLVHCLVLLDETENVTDPDALEQIVARALVRARRRTAADLRGIVRQLVADLDPDAAGRFEQARHERRVTVTRHKDGMATVSITHEQPLVDAMAATLAGDADQLRADAKAAAQAQAEQADAGPASPDASSAEDLDLDAQPAAVVVPSKDQAMADAAVTRILGSVAEDGSIVFDRAAATKVTVEVVIDLDTLAGIRAAMGLVNGEPVPADVAVAYARQAHWLRRIVTAPVDGHLLDYGDLIYLPGRLNRHSHARDYCCRACGSRRNLQMDHACPFPHGGSCTANCGLLCLDCHQRKTRGLLRIVESSADGSATFVTHWGQTFRVRPRPYLPDTERDTRHDAQPEPPIDPRLAASPGLTSCPHTASVDPAADPPPF